MNFDRNTLILGTRKGVLVFEKAGGKWRLGGEHYPGVRVSYAMFDDRNDLFWICADHGHWGQKLYRSEDRGGNWVEIAAPVYPEGAEIKEGVPATLRYNWVLTGGGRDRPDALYLGTEPGGLFRSDDGGNTFSLVRPLWDQPSRPGNWFGGGLDYPGIHSVVVDPRNSKRILIGISVAGVFETTDDGKTWTTRNKGLRADFLPDPDAEVGHDPHMLVACGSHPDVLWQQNHCGIFVSSDGAKNWIDVSEKEGPARFGFCIAVDNADPDTAWVVPAVSDEKRIAVGGALCVCRTTDRGKTWESLRKGLPQERSYDVVFRHALDVNGDTIAFGSTTGNLFVSEDRGESWESLGNHLPPIHSVRFAVKDT